MAFLPATDWVITADQRLAACEPIGVGVSARLRQGQEPRLTLVRAEAVHVEKIGMRFGNRMRNLLLLKLAKIAFRNESSTARFSIMFM